MKIGTKKHIYSVHYKIIRSDTKITKLEIPFFVGAFQYE